MEHIDFKNFLPYGNTLVTLFDNRGVTNSKLNGLLKDRGIFIGKSYEQIAPLFLSSLISPTEFEQIKKLLRSKEDTEKTSTMKINFSSVEHLIKCVPDKMQNLIKNDVEKELRGVKLNNCTNFSKNKNNSEQISLEFVCETNNYNSSWYRVKDKFQGHIILFKKDGELSIRSKTTAKETEDIAQIIIRKLKNYFDTKGYTKVEDRFKKITFDIFSNEKRCEFLLGLAQTKGAFEINCISNFEIVPDERDKLSNDVKQIMSGEVSQLNVKGEALSKHVLLTETQNHRYVGLISLEVLYNFKLPSAEGKCSILFGFLSYLPKKYGSSEFKVNFLDVKLDEKYKSVNIKNVTNKLIEDFELTKEEIYHLVTGENNEA